VKEVITMKKANSEEIRIAKKNIWDMSKEEIEAFFAEATKQAQDDLHANGLPYIVGGVSGTYEVYPGGKKVFTPYERFRVNGDR